MPLVKLWNTNRSIRKLIVTDDLKGLIRIGREKFGFHSDDKLKVVMESDGNELEDEEVFSALIAENLFPSTVLLLMQETETWTSHQEENSYQDSTSTKHLPGSSNAPQSLDNSCCSTSPQSSCESDDQFNIPWDLFPKNVIDACIANRVPSAVQVRQLVRILVEEIMSFTPRPKRGFINKLARQIVGKYPTLGLQQGNGYDHERLFDQLENRVRNVQRPTNKSSLQNKLSDCEAGGAPSIKKARKYSHGCTQWQPDSYSEGETWESQTAKKEWLHEQHSSSAIENQEIEAAMANTYTLQRLAINKPSSIPAVIDEWPYLFHRKLFLLHANVLLGKNIIKVWRDEVKKKLPELVHHFRSCPKMMTAMKAMEIAIAINKCKVPEEAGLIPMLTSYFEEDESSIVRYFENTASADDIKDSLDTPLPIIAVLGNSMFNNENAYVIVEKVIVGDIGQITDVVPVYFACFFVFNLEYPARAGATMEFIQRLILNINPEGAGNRRGPGNKKRTKVHPKVLSLIGELQREQSVWNIN